MGLLDFFNRRKTLKEAVDLSLVATDIHSHFIFGIDDGAKSLNDSINLVKGMKNMGYNKLITTPHVMSDFYQNTTAIIKDGLCKLQDELIRQGVDIKLEAAAEYYLDTEFVNLLKAKDLLTFGDRYLLFEVSYLNEPDNLDSIIFMLQSEGYKPVMAHPERYPYWYNKFERYKELSERGVFLQLNINSLTGYYSPVTQKIAERMINEGIVSFLGSDCHHSGHQELMKKAVYNPALKKLIDSGKLLNASV